MLHVRYSAQQRGEITKFEALTTTQAHKCESLILYFYSETTRTNLFLGYFVHIVRRERDGLRAGYYLCRGGGGGAQGCLDWLEGEAFFF